MDWLTSADGPLFIWRFGRRAYSEKFGRDFTVPEFRGHYDELILEILLARAREITDTEASDNRPRKRLAVARATWNLWIDSALAEVFSGLPQQAGVGGVSVTDVADLRRAVKTALLAPVNVTDHMASTERVSVYDLACRGDAGPYWRQAGSHQAWTKIGPRVAVRYAFLAAQVKSLATWDSAALCTALRKMGVVRHGAVESGKTRAWIVEDEWIAKNMDQDIADDQEPQPATADTKKAAAGDKDEDPNEPLPF